MKLVIDTGGQATIVARELGIIEQTVGNWVKAYRPATRPAMKL